MTHILPTNSNTAGPVVMSNIENMTHTFRTCVSMCHGKLWEELRPTTENPASWSWRTALVVEGESALLQMLPLKHLGDVSKHMSTVSAVPAQRQRGEQP